MQQNRQRSHCTNVRDRSLSENTIFSCFTRVVKLTIDYEQNELNANCINEQKQDQTYDIARYAIIILTLQLRSVDEGKLRHTRVCRSIPIPSSPERDSIRLYCRVRLYTLHAVFPPQHSALLGNDQIQGIPVQRPPMLEFCLLSLLLCSLRCHA